MAVKLDIIRFYVVYGFHLGGSEANAGCPVGP